MNGSKKAPPVCIEALSKSFDKSVALKDISLTIERGEVLGLIGPNGSGKSTLLGIVSGIIKPDKGMVRVFGKDPYRCEGVRKRIGVLFQKTELFDRLRVSEAILFFSSLYPTAGSKDRIATALDLHRKKRAYFKHLSGGEKQKLGIIIAFMGNPDLLLLDEPGSNLDPPGKRQLWKLVEVSSQRGAAVMMSSHGLSEAARLCDRVVFLKDGRIIAIESPSRVLRSIKGGLVVELETRSEELLDKAYRMLADQGSVQKIAGGRLIVESGRAAEINNRLLPFLVAASDGGWRLEIRNARLEDAYRRYVS